MENKIIIIYIYIYSILELGCEWNWFLSMKIIKSTYVRILKIFLLKLCYISINRLRK